MRADKRSVRVDHFYSFSSSKEFNRPEEAHCYTMSAADPVSLLDLMLVLIKSLIDK